MKKAFSKNILYYFDLKKKKKEKKTKKPLKVSDVKS